MLKAVRAAQDHGLEEANQPAQQGSNSMDVQNLAQVKAEQIAWLKKRDAAGSVAEKCKLLEARIKTLQDLAW